MQEVPRRPESSGLKDALFAGALVLATTVFPAYGMLAGHTPAERVDSDQLLEVEGLVALGALEITGAKALRDMARQSSNTGH